MSPQDMTQEEIQAMRRKFWSPKRPEATAQCSSCPFRDDNDKEFGSVLQKLGAAEGHPIPEDVLPGVTAMARIKVRYEDTRHSGDFLCHQSVYKPGYAEKRDQDEWRQCPGATRAFKGEE